MYPPMLSVHVGTFRTQCIFWTLLFLHLLAWPGLTAEHVSVTPPHGAPDAETVRPLTAAQQAAQDLAANLAADEPRVAVPAPSSPLFRLQEPLVRRGPRPVLVLYTSDHLDVRVVRGPDTLASSVDDLSAAPADARRPLLSDAAQGALALELLID